MSETTELIAKQIMNGNINKRTWGDILYNVKVYGAVGDGIKDDTIAIQEAIDYALSVGGKAIFFPHGTYKVTALTSLSLVVLFGDNASFVGISDIINQIGKPSSNLVYNVKDYEAKGDGVTNDAPAIQSAINAATTNGGGIAFLPPGTYRCDATLSINRTTEPNRVSLIGSGAGSTVLKYSGSGTLIDVIGNGSGVNDNYLSFQTISGMELVTTTSVQGIGVSLYNLGMIKLSDLRISGFDKGLYINGVEHSRFDTLSFRWNKKGIHATSTDFVALTCPNNLSFYSCHIASNSEYGAYFEFPTTVNFVGGSIENNGTAAGITGALTNWGLKFRNAGYQGGVACNLLGVYIESNAGAADVWFENTAWEATVDNSTVYSVVGCTFNKGTSGWYTTNNIRCEFATEAQAEKQKLSVINSSFKGFGSYVPDASRKNIQYAGVPQTSNNFEQVGNIFGMDLENPSYLNAIGSIAALPTATVNNRGAIVRVEGGAGVTDTLYICMKSAADTYSWKTITTG